MALSAPLMTRKTCCQVKLEGTKGTVETTGFADLLCFDPKITTNAEWIDRRGTSKYFGHTQAGVVGEQLGTFTCGFEMRTTGSSAWDAAVVVLLQGAGMSLSSQTLTPVTAHASQKTITVRLSEDGVLKVLKGAMGNVSIEGVHGERVMGTAEFSGYYAQPTDVALPTYTPSVVAPAIMGTGAFTLATESIKIGKFGFATGNEVILRPGSGYYCITDRDPTITCDPEADLIGGYDYHAAFLAQTTAAFSLAFGTGTSVITLAAPLMKYKQLEPGDRNGIRIYDITGTPVANTGDDEYSWVAS